MEFKSKKPVQQKEQQDKEEVKPSTAVQDMLNDQIAKEFYSVLVYEYLSHLADEADYVFMAKWLMMKAAEELTHKHKFIGYMYERGWKVEASGVDTPPKIEGDPLSILNAALAHEKSVTKSISEIQYKAEEERDRLTYNFLDSLMIEQIEEEGKLMDYISNFKLSTDKLVFDLQFNK